MKKKLVSVIIPIYSVEQFLEKCVESVVKQTYENIEIILVDDGSPDDCGKILKLFIGMCSFRMTNSFLIWKRAFTQY